MSEYDEMRKREEAFARAQRAHIVTRQFDRLSRLSVSEEEAERLLAELRQRNGAT